MARIILSDSQIQELKGNMPEGEFRRAYTGRGMVGYGEPSKTAIGYVGNAPELFAFELAAILAAANNDQYEYAPSDRPHPEDVINDVRDYLDQIGPPSSDSMGLDTIYYWRNITAQNPMSDDDEENDL